MKETSASMQDGPNQNFFLLFWFCSESLKMFKEKSQKKELIIYSGFPIFEIKMICTKSINTFEFKNLKIKLNLITLVSYALEDTDKFRFKFPLCIH